MQFRAHHRGARDHGLELLEGDITRQVFHAAIWRHDQPLGGDMRQPAADAGGDLCWRFHRAAAQIDDPEDDGFSGQLREYAQIEIGLRGFIPLKLSIVRYALSFEIASRPV